MRFVLLNTKNNAGLIEALADRCDVIDENHSSANANNSHDAQLREKIHAIVERNVTRRRIRFPKVFGFSLVTRIYRAAVRRREIKRYQRYYSALAANEDRVVLVFNGYLAPNALLDLAAQSLGMKTLYLENGFFPKTMQCDRLGINALSSLPRDGGFYDALPNEAIGDAWPSTLVVRPSKLKDGNVVKAGQDLPSSYVFVPFQVPSDMQILALSPWIKDMVHLYEEIVALAEADPSRHFVIKEHPSFPLSIQGKVTHHDQVHFRNGHVTSDLIAQSDAVLTVNSTVGLEALTLGRKILTLGEAHYAIDGIALSAHDRKSLHAAMQTINEWQPDEVRRDRFVRFAYNQYLLPLDRVEPSDLTFDLLRQRAEGTDNYSKMTGAR